MRVTDRCPSNKLLKYTLHELNINLWAGICEPSIVQRTTSVNLSDRSRAATEPFKCELCECHFNWYVSVDVILHHVYIHFHCKRHIIRNRFEKKIVYISLLWKQPNNQITICLLIQLSQTTHTRTSFGYDNDCDQAFDFVFVLDTYLENNI